MSETTPLVPGKKRLSRLSVKGDLNLPGVTPSDFKTVSKPHKTMSLVMQSNLADQAPSGTFQKFEGMPTRTYSIKPDGTVSNMTPVEMAREELYEEIPFTAVMGMQKKERNVSRAFASFAANLDAMEADQFATSSGETLTDSEKEEYKRNASAILLGDIEQEKIMLTGPLIFAVLVASVTQFIVGYNIGVMNPAEAVVFPGHSTTSWAIAVAAFCVGGPFGAVIAGNLAETRGRRGALLITTTSFLVGGLLQTLAPEMITITVARLIIGLGSGASSVLVPIYLGEHAPPMLRGTFGTLTQFALVVGILIADLLGFPFATEKGWRLLFAVTPILAGLQLLGSPLLLETPRWLLNRDPNSRKARFIIKKMRGMRYDFEVETEANHYVSASRAQKLNTDDSAESKNAVVEMFTDKKIRLLVFSTLVLQMAQQLCGINAVFYYSNMFFEGVIDNPLEGSTIVAAVNVFATWIALLIMDSSGRKTLIMVSSGGMFFCCVFVVMSLLGYFSNIVALIAVNLYVSFFEIGLGPIPWLIVPEFFDSKYVTTAMSVSSQVNWSCNFIISMVFPYMNKYLGPYSFGPFAIVLLLTFLFSWTVLPETHGTTPEEIQAMLAKKNASVVYHNIDIEGSHINPLKDEWEMAMETLREEEEDE